MDSDPPLKDFAVEISGRDLTQAFNKVERHVGRAVHGRCKAQDLELFLHCLDNARMTVS